MGHTNSPASPDPPPSSTGKKAYEKPQPPFWIHFISGGVAGSISSFVTCPLELVKTRFQSSHYFSDNMKISFRKAPLKASIAHVSSTINALKSIYQNEGFFALWKGVGATLIGVIPSRAIYFSSYQTSKSYLLSSVFEGKESSAVHMLSAISAGIITTTATNPIWLIKTRMQLQSTPRLYRNSFDCLKTIIRQEGPRSLYQGMTASYLGCIEGTIQWVLYEKLKPFFQGNSPVGEGTFFAAAISKIFACCLTYPHEVLRTRLRQGSIGNPQNVAPYKGLIPTVRRIYLEGGMAPFYGGMTAHLLRVVPNAAIMFFCYEFLIHTYSYHLQSASNYSSTESEEFDAV